MSRLIISEEERKNIFSLYNLLEQEEEKGPCPEGKEEDELVTYDEIKNGKVIKKGYCNSNPNSGIIKVQKMLKRLGHLKWDGLLGYYGNKTAEALSDFFKNQACSRDTDGSALGPQTITLLEDPNRYNRYYSNEDIIAATLWGEARGEGIEGQKAVYSILKNRALRNSDSKLTLKAKIAGEALRPQQFSYWNNKGFSSNPRCSNGNLGVDPESLDSYRDIVNNDLTINIGDATHYVNKKHATDSNKWWENEDEFKLVKTIGNHEFYKEV